MKKFFFLLAVVSFLFAGNAMAQVTGTVHDLSEVTNTINVPGITVCQGCHTPHNARSTDIPLSSRTSNGGLTAYGTTAGGSTGAVTTVAQVCMSCHDATKDVTDFVGGPAAGTTMTAGVEVDVDLANTHPVGGTIQIKADDTVNWTGDTSLGTVGSTMDCTTCHNPHDNGNTFFLKTTVDALCPTCHRK